MLEKVLLFEEIDSKDTLHLFETGEGGNGAQVIVEHNTELPPARQGFGTVHHSAFRVHDQKELEQWIERMPSFGFRTSGFVDRHYFASLYVNARSANFI